MKTVILLWCAVLIIAVAGAGARPPSSLVFHRAATMMRKSLPGLPRLEKATGIVVPLATTSVMIQGETRQDPQRLLERIEIDPSGRHFRKSVCQERFYVWGFNYDHDRHGRLLEDYWHEEWEQVAGDFREMKNLGANVVRIHLQTNRFLSGPKTLNQRSLQRLAKLITLAEHEGLYLDLTGLGCYHRNDNPAWYDELTEKERWKAQAIFWEGIARTAKGSDAIFCYNLMNEPILPGKGDVASDWLAGEFGGKHFVQRLSLDLRGRTRLELADQWVSQMVDAIRVQDAHHLVTVGVIPWAYTFPGAKPIFYSEAVAQHLDFVSIHLYPERDQLPKALSVLDTYQIGKPIVIEETFLLRCGLHEFQDFLQQSRPQIDGYLGFYWGQTEQEYLEGEPDIPAQMMQQWLAYFRKNATEFTQRQEHSTNSQRN